MSSAALNSLVLLLLVERIKLTWRIWLRCDRGQVCSPSDSFPPRLLGDLAIVSCLRLLQRPSDFVSPLLLLDLHLQLRPHPLHAILFFLDVQASFLLLFYHYYKTYVDPRRSSTASTPEAHAGGGLGRWGGACEVTRFSLRTLCVARQNRCATGITWISPHHVWTSD